MQNADPISVPLRRSRSFIALLLDAVTLVVRAFLGSLLGISTATVFGIFVLVAMAGLPLDVAITAVAIGMNGMLLSLVTLGNMYRNDDE
jgi:hypothetical protein